MENNQSLIERVRFYLSDETKVAKALLAIRNAEKMLEEAKERVKEKANEFMDKAQKDVIAYSITDPDTGEIREWEVKRIYGGMTKEYKASEVLKILSERAVPFLKVNKTKLDTYLKKESAKGNLSMELVNEISKEENCILKTRKGSIQLKEVKVR